MADTTANVLVVDDERNICMSCKKILEEEGYRVDYILSGKEGVKKAVAGDYQIVLLDLKMPDLPGLEALGLIKKQRPDVSVIIITGYATIQTSIEAIKKGAFDYVPKPFTPEELAIVVSKAIKDRQLRSENEYLKNELSKLRKTTKMIGRSSALNDIKNQILKIAPTDFTVMIYGESGTGKELIARSIHENSLREDKQFVAVDISSLSPTLVESELFGHVKGAFTGASQNRPGYFAIADKGTLFIDEISNIGLELQGKLLRVFENKTIRPVGGEHIHEVDVRIIVATNKDLHELVEEGKFREDLYYRLNVIPINVKALRERSEDIPLLAMHFLEKAVEEISAEVIGFTTEAMAKIVSYRWPGNVRELSNVVKRLVATTDSELIQIEHLPPEISGISTAPREMDFRSTPQTAAELKETKRHLREMVYAKVERDFILNALELSNWNVTHAAERVGMQRTNFHGLMRKYDIYAKGER